jgi:hypothetical protein
MQTDKIELTVQEVHSKYASCNVCDAPIEGAIAASNREADIDVCADCVYVGHEKIDERLRDRAVAEHEAIPGQIAKLQREIAELEAQYREGPQATTSGKLIGHLQVPDREEYRAKALQCDIEEGRGQRLPWEPIPSPFSSENEAF